MSRQLHAMRNEKEMAVMAMRGEVSPSTSSSLVSGLKREYARMPGSWAARY